MPDYGWVLLGFLVTILTVLSFRVRFDVNEWMRDRHQRALERAKNLCTHTKIDFESDTIGSWFRSPSGTTQWVCERCGLVALGEEFAHAQMAYWVNHPKEYVERERAFVKHVKKMGLA